MKATGIVRKVDKLGRLTLPKELRKEYGMNETEKIEIYSEGEYMVLENAEQAKNKGIIREVDNLGRLVLPVELRRFHDIAITDPCEFLIEDSRVLIRKYEPGCIFCKKADDVTSFKNKYVCLHCIKELTE